METTFNAYQPVSLGTTLVAVVFNGGIVFGADSRTSSGSLIVNRTKSKIRQLSDRIYVASAGNASHSETIRDYVQQSLRMYSAETQGEPRVLAAATIYRNMIYQNKSFLGSSIICGGYDEVDGFSIYRVVQSGALKKCEYALGGSGSSYIYGYWDAHYKANMTEQQAKEFVINAVSLAIKRDGSSGGCVHTVVITKDNVQDEWIPGDQVAIPQH